MSKIFFYLGCGYPCEKEKKRQNFTVYMYVQPNKHAIHQISRQADTKAQNSDHLNSVSIILMSYRHFYNACISPNEV